MLLQSAGRCCGKHNFLVGWDDRFGSGPQHDGHFSSTAATG